MASRQVRKAWAFPSNPGKSPLIADKVLFDEKVLKILIKDGIMTYKVGLSPKLECQCDSNTDNIYCNHIFYLLSKVYHLSDLTITFIHLKQVHEHFIKYIMRNNNTESVDELNNILEEELAKYFAKEVCGICLLSLDHKKFNYDIFTCEKCNLIC